MLEWLVSIHTVSNFACEMRLINFSLLWSLLFARVKNTVSAMTPFLLCHLLQTPSAVPHILMPSQTPCCVLFYACVFHFTYHSCHGEQVTCPSLCACFAFWGIMFVVCSTWLRTYSKLLLITSFGKHTRTVYFSLSTMVLSIRSIVG